MRRAPQLCVLAAQPGELGQAHAGSKCRNEQCVVTTSRPGRAIRSGDERTHLGLGEIAAREGLGSLLRDREHLPDGVRMLRMAIGREAEKGVDGRQSGVAGADGVAPSGLEVIEEGARRARHRGLRCRARRGPYPCGPWRRRAATEKCGDRSRWCDGWHRVRLRGG